MIYLSLLLALVAAAAIFLVVQGLLGPSSTPSDMLEARLAHFAETGQAVRTLSEVEMTLPFFERTLRPRLDKIGRYIAGRSSALRNQALQDKLNLAGRPWGISNPGAFLALQGMGTVLFTAIGLVAGLLWASGTTLLLCAVGGCILGYLLPVLLLGRKVRRRRKEILLALPNALDLLTVSVEAGLGFDAALVRVVDKYHNALSSEFNQALNEIRLGRARSEALEELGKRSKVEELNAFCQAIVQSETLGVGIANVLRIQAEEIRRRRRQRAEEQAQKAPLKMLFPMVFCIFPTLLVVLLGPAAIVALHLS